LTTDLLIARNTRLRPITDIAAAAGIGEDHLEPYGRFKAKISETILPTLPDRAGALVLVTGISPTPAGEGKTTTTIGLADALAAAGSRTMICLREPSLGPCFGMKGGATGGGRAQVAPMEDINLHFTGDFHAITAANNLLSALIDNHLFWGNELGIDPRRITWRRCADVNDRALRQMVASLGGGANGNAREDGFDITVASEVMAIFCLAQNLADLEARLARIIVATRRDGSAITAGDLAAPGAMAVLLRDALRPNLVQSLEGTPALVHGGPFANIAWPISWSPKPGSAPISAAKNSSTSNAPAPASRRAPASWSPPCGRSRCMAASPNPPSAPKTPRRCATARET
jgi:formate--tetrahydrofolate ligase